MARSGQPAVLRRVGTENVDYHFHSPTDTNASIVGSHFWVYVLQLPRARQATHTPAYFCWTRTLAIVGKHVLQFCTPHHSYIYQARRVSGQGPAPRRTRPGTAPSLPGPASVVRRGFPTARRAAGGRGRPTGPGRAAGGSNGGTGGTQSDCDGRRWATQSHMPRHTGATGYASAPIRTQYHTRLTEFYLPCSRLPPASGSD